VRPSVDELLSRVRACLDKIEADEIDSFDDQEEIGHPEPEQRSEIEPEPDIPFGTRPIPVPALTISAHDPIVEPWLDALETYFRSSGLTVRHFSAREICNLPECPKPTISIPPRGLWHCAVDSLRAFEEIRLELGSPIAIRGYRPPDYNAAVGGVRSSSHQWFAGFDLRATDREARRELAEIVVRKLRTPWASEKKPGVGIYGFPTARRVHIDAGVRSRPTRWAQTAEWERSIDDTR